MLLNQCSQLAKWSIIAFVYLTLIGYRFLLQCKNNVSWHRRNQLIHKKYSHFTSCLLIFTSSYILYILYNALMLYLIWLFMLYTDAFVFVWMTWLSLLFSLYICTIQKCPYQGCIKGFFTSYTSYQGRQIRPFHQAEVFKVLRIPLKRTMC